MPTLSKDILISQLKEILPKFPIRKAWLFGSYATGEATPESDIDLLVDYDKDDDFTLFTIGGIISSISKFLGHSVDVVESGHLLPFANNHVEQTKILIYERGA